MRLVRSLAAAAALVAATVVFAAERGTSHPHFDDRGTLSWSVRLADAQTAARTSDKLIFVEYGRKP